MTATVDAPAAFLAARRPAVIDQPGVYSISDVDYHRDPVPGGSLSNSEAKHLMPPEGCPARFRWEKDHKKPTKRVFEIGTAAHAEVLGTGPLLVKIEADNWRKAETNQKADDARAEGSIPLLTHEYRMVMDMAEALRAHPVASALFSPDRGDAEQSLFWIDGPTGVMRRSRLDHLPFPTDSRMLLVDYKGLALDTPIPTVSGWTTMGALKVGDQVFDAAGQPCTVTQKSDVHMRKCYRLRFDDGSSIVADDEHLWVTAAGRKAEKVAVRNTEEIRATLKLYGQNQHRIAVAGPLALPDMLLPIHPYVLGCWIGDGAAACGRISKPDDELFELIAECGYELGKPWPSAPKCQTRTVLGLSKQLRREGLIGNKHIPDRYLRAGHGQRLDLLRGLMDTDGSWNSTRQQAVFSTVEKALAVSVRELACSLGLRAVIHEIQATGFGRTVTAYQVTFTPTRGLNPFKLSRKADRVAVRNEMKSLRRVVVAVDEMPAVPTQCIAVDSPSRTYLCTEAMIPTHNTCIKADEVSCAKAVLNYRYHHQGATYTDGVIALGRAAEVSYLICFQEKQAPYLIHIFEVDAMFLAIARDQNRAALEAYAKCVAEDRWPAWESVDLLGAPAWLENQYLKGEL